MPDRLNMGETRSRVTWSPWPLNPLHLLLFLLLAIFTAHLAAGAVPSHGTDIGTTQTTAATSAVGGSPNSETSTLRTQMESVILKLKNGSKAAGNRTTSTLPVPPSALPDGRVEGTLPHEEYNNGEYRCVQPKKIISSSDFAEVDGCVIMSEILEILFWTDCFSGTAKGYNVFLPPTSNPNVTATVVGKVADSSCPFFTVHNASFLDNYDEEFASSCHDFICKLKILGQAPVDDGYTEQYFEHPGSLTDKSKRCMQMAARNGALYHENEYLIMLSFSKVKSTLPILSVISYKHTPKVPFHELGFLFLREKRYECIKSLFYSVAGRGEGEFGLIFVSRSFSQVRKLCADHSETPTYWSRLKVIPTEPTRMILLGECQLWEYYYLNAIFIQNPFRITSNTITDLYHRRLHTFSIQESQHVLVFDMPQDVLKRHPLLTENGNAITCTFRSRVTVCRIYPGRLTDIFIFIHECNPHYLTHTLMRSYESAFYRLLLDAEMEWDICSNDTSITSLPSIIRLSNYYCQHFDYYLLDPGDTQSVQKSRIVHHFTYLRVYHLGSFVECRINGISKVYKVERMKNPYLFFNEHGSTLREIIAQLEKRLGVDELTLMTESEYKWYLQTYLQIAVMNMNIENSGCVNEMRVGKGITNEQNAITITRGDRESSKINYCYPSLLKTKIPVSLAVIDYKKYTLNLFWPACGSLYSVVITEKPIASEWQYLTTSCRVTQIFFLVMTAFITLVTIGGNSFVLYVIHKFRMYEIRSYGASFFILRSLAVADLLTGVFPGALAVWDQLRLMTGQLTLRKLSKSDEHQFIYSPDVFIDIDKKLLETASLRDQRFKREGYPVLCGYVLSVSSIVSLLMLFLLSVERYRGVRNLPFPCVPAAASVATSWIVASIMGLILFNRDDGFRPTGYFDPISKLTVSTAQSVHSPSIIFFWLQVASVGFLGCSMIFITFFTFYTHVSYRLKREKETKVTLHAPENVAMQDLKYFFMFFTMMLLYLVSCLPLAVHTFFGLSEVAPVLQFLAWWLFMAGGSWNWYIYSYRRGPFRRNLEKLAKRRENRKKIRREFQQQMEMQQRDNVGARLRRQKPCGTGVCL